MILNASAIELIPLSEGLPYKGAVCCGNPLAYTLGCFQFSLPPLA